MAEFRQSMAMLGDELDGSTVSADTQAVQGGRRLAAELGPSMQEHPAPGFSHDHELNYR